MIKPIAYKALIHDAISKMKHLHLQDHHGPVHELLNLKTSLSRWDVNADGSLDEAETLAMPYDWQDNPETPHLFIQYYDTGTKVSRYDRTTHQDLEAFIKGFTKEAIKTAKKWDLSDEDSGTVSALHYVRVSLERSTFGCEIDCAPYAQIRTVVATAQPKLTVATSQPKLIVAGGGRNTTPVTATPQEKTKTEAIDSNQE